MSDNSLAQIQFYFVLRRRFSLVIRSTDNGSPPMKLEKTFTISVTDVNEKPTAIQVTKPPRRKKKVITRDITLKIQKDDVLHSAGLPQYIGA